MARYVDIEKEILKMQSVLDQRSEYKDTVTYFAFEQIIEILKIAPTADVVPVVRCKDCQNCEVIYPVKIIGQEPEEVYFCKAHNGSRKPTDFCSDGRNKDEISKATDS